MEEKPDNSEKHTLNTYINDLGRLEWNINLATKIEQQMDAPDCWKHMPMAYLQKTILIKTDF